MRVCLVIVSQIRLLAGVTAKCIDTGLLFFMRPGQVTARHYSRVVMVLDINLLENEFQRCVIYIVDVSTHTATANDLMVSTSSFDRTWY